MNKMGHDWEPKKGNIANYGIFYCTKCHHNLQAEQFYRTVFKDKFLCREHEFTCEELLIKLVMEE